MKEENKIKYNKKMYSEGEHCFHIHMTEEADTIQELKQKIAHNNQRFFLTLMSSSKCSDIDLSDPNFLDDLEPNGILPEDVYIKGNNTIYKINEKYVAYLEYIGHYRRNLYHDAEYPFKNQERGHSYNPKTDIPITIAHSTPIITHPIKMHTTRQIPDILSKSDNNTATQVIAKEINKTILEHIIKTVGTSTLTQIKIGSPRIISIDSKDSQTPASFSFEYGYHAIFSQEIQPQCTLKKYQNDINIK